MGKTVLVKSPETFKTELEGQIRKGKELSLNDLAPRYSRYYFYPSGSKEIPIQKKEMSEKEKQSLEDFHSWSDYNSELLKQSFNVPNNEYLRDYNNSGLRIYLHGDVDWIKNAKEELSQKITYLQRLIEKLPLLPYSCNYNIKEQETANHTGNDMRKDLKKIFIVHGHDSALRTEVELFIRQLGYDPIVLFKQPNKGSTIIEKIEREAKDVAYSIILYTACDLGKAKDAEKLSPRARQNVVFEHGYMCARLGRDRVCALLEPGVEMPGDLSGVVYIECDKVGAWKLSVIKEMKAVGMEVDANRLV